MSIIAIVGPTASGKSGVALELAKRIGGEIIAADSRTVYRYMDIGTAKPTTQDRAEVPHHCIDIVDPGERFTVADFQQAALKVISDIKARNKTPIIVGGTGLYVDSVIFDYDFSARNDADPAKRKELEALSNDQLLRLIPEDDRKHFEHQMNRRHMVRFLETGSLAPQNKNMIDGARVFGIQPLKNKLRQRIEQRVEIMFKQGLRKEVDELIERYGWESEALTGIGYREFRPFYDGEISMSKVKRDIVQNSLRYAKRQRTWFKRNPAIRWHESAEALDEDLKNIL